MSRCYDVILRLYRRYKFYKNKCSELESKLQEMQRAYDRCQMLLKSHEQELTDNTEMTPKKNSAEFEIEPGTDNTEMTPKKNSAEFEIEPGSNKWECIESPERLNLRLYNESKVEEDLETEDSSSCSAKQQRNHVNPDYSPGHIRKYPRCEKHQPFFVSSLRKIAKLSPLKRALATNQRQRSPKGFWDLEMPSTEFIRGRYQDE